VPEKTPEEAWTGVKPDVSHFRVFGCTAYALIPAQLRSKLDQKSRRCLFLGYNHDSGSKSYRLYDPETQRLFSSRDVLFDEVITAPGEETTSEEIDRQHLEQRTSTQLEQEVPATVDDTPASQPNVQQPAVAPVLDVPLRRSTRARQPSRRYNDEYGSVAEALIATSDEPQTLHDALSSPEAHLWQAAIDDELASLRENNVYKIG